MQPACPIGRWTPCGSTSTRAADWWPPATRHCSTKSAGRGQIFGLGRPVRREVPGLLGDPAVTGDYDFTKTFNAKTFWDRPDNIAAVNWDGSPFQRAAQWKRLGSSPEVHFRGGMTRVTPPATGSQQMLTIRQTDWSNNAAKIGKDPIPGAVLNRVGKGQVIYFAAGVDGAYYSYSYPYRRNLLAQAMSMVASRGPTSRSPRRCAFRPLSSSKRTSKAAAVGPSVQRRQHHVEPRRSGDRGAAA